MVPTCDVSESLRVPGRRLLADGKSSSGQSVRSSFARNIQTTSLLLWVSAAEGSGQALTGSRHLSDGLAACSQVMSEKEKEKGADPRRSQSAQPAVAAWQRLSCPGWGQLPGVKGALAGAL